MGTLFKENELASCLHFNPFTDTACKNYGLKDACTHAPANSIFSSPITHLLSMLYISIKIFLDPGVKKKQKGIRVSNLALLLIVFKLHHGSEGVNNNEMFIKHALLT